MLALTAPWLGAQVRAQEAVSSDSNYVIQISDLLRFVVFQEPELQQEFRVPQNGKVSFHLIGEVDLTGRTVAEAEALLRDRYNQDYLVNPQVNLLVLEFSERGVTVIGQVNQPGTIMFPPQKEMTLMDAISKAGGFTRLARTSSVTLTRFEPDGRPTVHTINVDQILEGKSNTIWVLQKGDIINVPERFF